MDEGSIDQAAMGKLASALTFLRGADDPTTVALRSAAASGKPADIKKARALFLKLKPSDRKGALAMLQED
ncbi:MAG: hypothetical protein SGJ21_14555 [Alphaproteobacteria bacterium]|nr:hypothetical protein [Alphaproteobacteria bacterium]